jgi:translation initiation factor 3 subunit D
VGIADYLTVNENWNEPDRSDKESINHPSNLSTEATFIAQCFSQQVLDPAEDDEDRHDLGEPLPFADRVVKGMTPASVGYRYRAFTLADDIKVVARAEVNAYVTRKGEPQLLAVKTLNEFDSKVSGNVDWRQKLETQSGAVLAVEMKNNANRLMKYVAQTAMSGVNEVKLG